MGTVANSNFGFKGTVSSAETPQVFGIGALYSVRGQGDLKVTAGGTGDRAVTIAAGSAWGDGVLSKWTTGANLNCAANSTGATRYDTVVRRSTWTPAGSPTGTSTLMVLTGGSSATIAAGRATDRGVTSSDQPLALVPVPNGSAVVGTPIDLRCWTGEGGGLVAEHVAALQYLGSKGTRVQIGPSTYSRLEDASGTLYWHQSDHTVRGIKLVTTNANGDFSIVHNGGFSADQVIFLQDFGSANGTGYGPILLKPNYSGASTAGTIVGRAFSPAPGTPPMANITFLVAYQVVGRPA